MCGCLLKELNLDPWVLKGAGPPEALSPVPSSRVGGLQTSLSPWVGRSGSDSSQRGFRETQEGPLPLPQDVGPDKKRLCFASRHPSQSRPYALVPEKAFVPDV